MKGKNFEKELPTSYKQALYINAKDTKLGIIFNLIAFAVLAAVMAIAIIPLCVGGISISVDDSKELIIGWFALMVGMIGYIILHELTHGAAYKLLTHEKLTFGISWSCAFCGVPNIYTYKKTSLISTAAPLTLFTLILIPLTAILYFVSPIYYLVSAFIFGLHLGGCSGDIYVMYLLIFRFRGKRTLVKDTGPEQHFYIEMQTTDCI